MDESAESGVKASAIDVVLEGRVKEVAIEVGFVRVTEAEERGPADKPKAIVVQENGQVIGYACGVCGAVWLAFADMMGARSEEQILQAHASAKHCCAPVCAICKTPGHGRGWVVCGQCQATREEGKARADFEKARKVRLEEYDGKWVSWPDHGRNEGYFGSVEDLLAFCEASSIDPPAFVWGCYSVEFSLDADEIIEAAIEEHHTEARSEISRSEENRLQSFLDEWSKAQKITTYYEDRSIAVCIARGTDEIADSLVNALQKRGVEAAKLADWRDAAGSKHRVAVWVDNGLLCVDVLPSGGACPVPLDMSRAMMLLAQVAALPLDCGADAAIDALRNPSSEAISNG